MTKQNGNQFIGADGNYGVTVYKPINTKIFDVLVKMIDEEINSIDIQLDNYQFDKEKESYRLIKKELVGRTAIDMFVNTTKLYKINLRFENGLSVTEAKTTHKHKFGKQYKNSILKCFHFQIEKENKHNKIFTYSIIFIISKKGVELFLMNKQFSYKIKMRMFRKNTPTNNVYNSYEMNVS